MKILSNVIYHLKCNIFRYLSLLFSFSLIFIGFVSFRNGIIENRNNFIFYSSSNVNEIWFAESPINSECFFNLNGNSLSEKSDSNKSMNADILMQIKGVSYIDNLFSLDYEIKSNECVISKNIASLYSLSIGDNIYFNKDNSFTVSSIIHSQSGIDEEYNHKGIVILGFNEESLDSVKNGITYIFFAKDGTGYFNVINVIFLDKIKKKAKDYIKYTVLLSLVICAVAILINLLVFRKKQSDYKLIVEDGAKKNKLFINIFIDEAIIILLPVLISLLINIGYIDLFYDGYLYALICFSSLSIVITIFMTFIIYIRRIKYGRIK